MRAFEQRRHARGRCIQCGTLKEDRALLRCASCRARVNACSRLYFARTFEPKTARGIAAKERRDAEVGR